MSVLRFALLAVLILGTVAVLKGQPRPEAQAATVAERARGLTFAPAVAAADRE